MDTKRLTIARNAIIAGIVAVVFIAVITIAAERAPALMGWLKATFTHHWIGKSVLTAVVFIVTFLVASAVPGASDERQLTRLLGSLCAISAAVALVLFGYFWFAA